MQTNLSEAIVELVNCGVFTVDRDLRVLTWNHFMQSHTGRSAETVVGMDLLGAFPELPQRWLRRKIEGVFVLGTPAYSSWEHRPFLFRFEHSRPITGTIDAMRQNCSFIPIEDDQGEVAAVGVTIVDATDVCMAYGELQDREKAVSSALAELTVRNRQLTELNEELAHAHQQLLQSEKLAAIGQLAAGVAHEINNPVGFVLSNLNTLEGYIRTLIRYAEDMERLVGAAAPSLRTDLRALAENADLDYLLGDAPTLVQESREGLARVRTIVIDLRDFSRIDSTHVWEWTDIHRCIESTLNIVHNEVKYRADLVRDYAEIPSVRCIPSQISQVVLNLVVNAAQAYDGNHDRHNPAPGTITVRTGIDPADASRVWFEVVDAGCGIPPEHLKRIFDPFFTTKPVGQGTGLGLSVTYGIVNAHHGQISVTSAVGMGTTFRVTLPADGSNLDDVNRTDALPMPEGPMDAQIQPSQPSQPSTAT